MVNKCGDKYVDNGQIYYSESITRFPEYEGQILGISITEEFKEVKV